MSRIAKMSFSVDRSSGRTLVDQLTAGLRMAIETGVYRVGEFLPSLDGISAGTGVSRIVARAAIRRLTAEGLVRPRPGVGCVVLPNGLRQWKGHVVIVGFELKDNYFFATVGAILRERLMREGYLISQAIVLKGPRGKYDCSQLDLVLRQNVSLAVVFLDQGGIGRRIAKGGVPTVTLDMKRKPVEGAVGHIRFASEVALPDFAAHCSVAGIRKVAYVTFHGTFANCEPALSACGIAVERWEVPPFPSDSAIESAQMGGLTFFEEFLSRSRPKLPDLLYFDDDHLASGALTALAHHGIRIPEDVRLVTWSNRGDGPFYPRSLSKIEADPFSAGRLTSDCVLTYLAGADFPSDVAIRATYVPGDSFPPC